MVPRNGSSSMRRKATPRTSSSPLRSELCGRRVLSRLQPTCGSTDRARSPTGSPVELSAPEPQEFEVASSAGNKEVPFSGDYAEFELSFDRKRSTDIHRRCRSGRASWNWRIKMPITLPLALPEMAGCRCRCGIKTWSSGTMWWARRSWISIDGCSKHRRTGP